MTATSELAPRDVARARYDEALRVRDAFNSQVVRRRAAWRGAPDGKAANTARRALAEAVAQQTKAEEDMRGAWKAWHKLGGPRG